MFTLAHEMVHVWLGKPGLFFPIKVRRETPGVEARRTERLIERVELRFEPSASRLFRPLPRNVLAPRLAVLELQTT